VKLLAATAAETPAMAAAHALAFAASWREDEFEDLLEGEGIYGFLAADGEEPLGVILCRIAADEVEVLTVGVPPAARRNGVARALMTAALGVARQHKAAQAFLEVAVDNDAAIALYQRLGFRRTGKRLYYYDRGEAGRVHALVMRLDLTPEPT
jgi:ribosomal-protein-alanine N-acetyltransferase